MWGIEIYNFLDLRRELEAGGARFRSPTDTEVILEAVAVGLAAALLLALAGNGFAAFSIAMLGILTTVLVFALGLVADLGRQILTR